MPAHGPIDTLKGAGAGLGLRAGHVKLVEHNPGWSTLFDGVARLITSAISDDVEVEHIGSTSVPGLAAKPILDIAVGQAAPFDKERVIEELRRVGFAYQSDLGIYGGLFFVVHSADDVVVAHVHVVEINDFQWRWYLAFRDGLRSDPQLRDDYQRLKQQSAESNATDRDGYTLAKFDWILATVQNLEDPKADAGEPNA